MPFAAPANVSIGQQCQNILSSELTMMDDDLIWKVRLFVYEWFVETTRAPSVDDIAERFAITPQAAGQALSSLHDRHALFLEPGAAVIRFANPFSGIPTPFTVKVGGKSYWANCAWDCFGVAAALQASEAAITSICARSGVALHLGVTRGRPSSDGEIVHFLVPFREWYDDLIHT